MKKSLSFLVLCCSTALFSALTLARPTEAADHNCSAAQLSSMTGYFVSQDGFYGSPHRIEYLNVELDSGYLVATKLVGDQNVPRGKVSWITLSPYRCIQNQSQLPIKIQARIDVNEPSGFFWMYKDNYVLMEDQNTLVVRFDCGLNCLAEGRLLRVKKNQAMDAASSMTDHQ